MRSRSWCSAALVALCVGCGSHRATDPFAYSKTPLAFRDRGVFMSNAKVDAHDVSFAGAGGATVSGFLFVPRTPGRHPAIVFLHGSGGSRVDLLVTAARISLGGVVALTISQPDDAVSYRPLVVNARRALDLLASRRDVDARRLGVVGYSLGGQTAALVAGDDPRVRAAAIIAGRGTDVARYWIARTHARLLFEAGTRDELVPHAQLVALIRAAPGRPLVRWFPAGHGMTVRAFDEAAAWTARQLR